MSQGGTQGGQGMQAETERTWATCVIRVLRWNVLYLWAKDRLVNSHLKRKHLDEFHGGLIRGAQGEGPGRYGRLLATKAVGEVLSGTHICVWLCRLLSRTCGNMRSQCHWKAPHRLLGQTKLMTKRQYQGVAWLNSSQNIKNPHLTSLYPNHLQFFL